VRWTIRSGEGLKKSLLQEIDHQENCALAAACKTQVLKVEAMERRLLEQTYTASTLPALSAVAQHLEAAEVEVEAKHQQVDLIRILDKAESIRYLHNELDVSQILLHFDRGTY
jgi:hypothetical protein